MRTKNKVLVYDLGIGNRKKKNYRNKNFSKYNDIISEISTEGTKVYSNEAKEGFYYINKKLDKDSNYEFSFTWVDGNNITPIIQIRESENMDILTTFQRAPNNIWQIYTNAKIENNGIVEFDGHKNFKEKEISPNNLIKLTKKGDEIKIYCNRKLVISCDVSLKSDFYIGFGGHAFDNRYTIFKELILKRIS